MFLSGWLASEFSEEEYEKISTHKDYYLDNNWSFQQVVQEVKNKLKLPQFDKT
jgi:hypothetical protein